MVNGLKLVLKFYGYIKNIEEILINIFTNINYSKLMKILRKFSKNNKIRNNTYIKIIL